jgi:ABC-type lipoprotein release transport system permease subunit
MIQIFKMSFRDLGRNKRRSFFSALALGMGLSLLLLMASVIRGEMRGSMESTIKLQSGHVQLHASAYDQDNTSLAWEDLIENPDQAAAKIAALSPVKAATPRLFASGIVTAGEESAGVKVIGIDPLSEANAPYRDGLVQGEFLSPDDREGILIGQPLAEKLNLNVGKQISLLVNTSNGDVDVQPFIIRGIYSSRTPGYDELNVFLPIAKAQAIARAENHASSIFILLNDRDQTQAVVASLQASNYQIVTWMDANELLIQTERFSAAYMMVLYLIVLAITATVIVNTLVMAVFERTREIGILSAIGMKSNRIMLMFFAESILLTVGGILIGLVLGGLMVYYGTVQGFFIGDMGITGIILGDTIHAYLTFSDTITLTIMAFIVSLLAALYPALLAARLEPVNALHGGK